MQPYPANIEQQMQRLYQSLNERDRRRYAAKLPNWDMEAFDTSVDSLGATTAR